LLYFPDAGTVQEGEPMDNKAPDKDKKSLLSGFLTSEEKIKMSVYYGGCMGTIVLVTFLVRWLVGIFKGF
jgi:hypothetical protein